MRKNIFNVLLVGLLIFITVYFALKISNYAMKFDEEDAKFNTSVSQYVYNYMLKK